MPLFIVVPKLPAAAMAIYPFILIKSKAFRDNPVIINHEKIHHKQQLELLIIPFYVIYAVNYLFNLLKYNRHNAYRKIVFEKEAYDNEYDFNYIKNRTLFAWIKRW
jgi:hypothetical protein